jgi:hypothetical protein
MHSLTANAGRADGIRASGITPVTDGTDELLRVHEPQWMVSLLRDDDEGHHQSRLRDIFSAILPDNGQIQVRDQLALLELTAPLRRLWYRLTRAAVT